MRGQGVIIRSEAHGSGTTVSLAGQLDLASAADIRLDLHRLIDLGAGAVRLDLGACTVADATGLGLLVEVQRRAHRRGRTLTIVSADDRTRRLLLRLRLGRLLHSLEPAARLAEPATA